MFLSDCSHRGRLSLEALACVGHIAKAMGPTMEPHVRGLLDPMFSTRFSVTLVDSLELLSERFSKFEQNFHELVLLCGVALCNICIFCLSIPPLLLTIHNRLFECISAILSRSHHPMSRQSVALSRGHLATITPQVPVLSGSVLVQLTLQTLARFNFKGHDLLEFARESVVIYLEDENGATQKDVALCCCKLIANSFLVMSSTQFSPCIINHANGKQRRLVERSNLLLRGIGSHKWQGYRTQLQIL
ncbi:serine/threonine-protein kinase TOR-like isoform X1 [Solanum tuberosum]|uniref:serine/threonine-protein kinase TOR-like isoform X1 n=1 Tax=Solanum tuberosum TaxID=4113 RepID=UPI0003D253C4|nr:PREDICTED: serine/threonine-protein kinase TOR-like isoform X1 [Solanum tuberosum]XP_006361565.1 PREDICTED: serine/threonine-protein kinase TOR-like isoform X1 [Solanum tuberosum]